MIGHESFSAMGRLPSRRRSEQAIPALQRWLVGLFAAVWLVLAVAPVDRLQWFAENLLVAGLAVMLYLARDLVVFSRPASISLFLFLCLHEVGAHYGYANVPYDRWLAVFASADPNEAFALDRNHFDRFMHFLFGLLLTQPLREALVATSPVRGAWSYILPVALSMAASMGYEVSEWLVVVIAGGETADLILQGDIWDAQKDMALATAGALIAITALKAANRARDREDEGRPPAMDRESGRGRNVAR